MADGPHANGFSLDTHPVQYFQPVCKVHDQGLKDENFGIRRVACSDNSVLTGSWRPWVQVWKLAESRVEQSCQLKHGASGVMNLEIADDANTVAVSQDDGAVVVWDLRETRRPAGLLQGADSSIAMQIKFLPGNSQQLISGGDSGNICFWDLRNFRLKMTRGCTGTGSSSASRPKADDSKFDHAKEDKSMSAKRLKRDPAVAGPNISAAAHGENGGVIQSPISSLALSNDGKLLGCGRVNGEVGVMFLDNLEWCGHVRAHFSQSSARVRGLAFDPSSRFLLSGGDDHHLGVLNIEHWARPIKGSAPKQPPVLERLAGHRGWVTSLSACPDPRQRFMLSTSMDRTVRLWDYSHHTMMKLPAEVKRSGAEDRERAHTSEVMDAAWAPGDGSFYVTVGSDALMALYTLTADAKEKMAIPTIPLDTIA